MGTPHGNATTCVPSRCGDGYCDTRAGLCICPPGWSGDACERHLLASCRVDAASTSTPCQGFAGVMSCACMAECWRALGRRSVEDKICFEVDGRPPALSGIPENASSGRLRYFARVLLDVPPGWRPSRLPATSKGWASRVKALRPLGITPLPNSRCPEACSRRGTCADHLDGRIPRCSCHAGFGGLACEREEPEHCVNRCSARGRCIDRFCRCDDGWAGFDCSARQRHGTAAAEGDGTGAARAPLAYAPTYVYPLPAEMSLRAMYQRDPTRRGTFHTNRVFLEMLHARRDALVDEPEDAALFLVPVMLVQMQDNLWAARAFLASVVEWIRGRHPYWNRTGGADHVFFTSQDMGGCWVPEVMRRSIIVSHFGFTANEAFWEDGARWKMSFTKGMPWRAGYNRTLPQCYVPGKDVVVPVDFSVPPGEVAHQLAALERECTADGAAPSAAPAPERALLYMAGSVHCPNRGGEYWYSQRVRQEFYRLHRNASGVVMDPSSHWRAAAMRNATFCLAPSGWGYGWRTYVSLAMNCIPVIVQPMVEQAFHDLLPYKTFSLRYAHVDLPRLPELLREVAQNRSRVCQMRAAAARYYRALLWAPPGIAYDLLQVTLCRRALALRKRQHAAAQQRLGSKRRRGRATKFAPPAWHGCAQLTAEALLARRAVATGGRGEEDEPSSWKLSGD